MSSVDIPKELFNFVFTTKPKQGDKQVKMLHDFEAHKNPKRASREVLLGLSENDNPISIVKLMNNRKAKTRTKHLLVD